MNESVLYVANRHAEEPSRPKVSVVNDIRQWENGRKSHVVAAVSMLDKDKE
jgi:hypothetical protein